MYTTRCTTTTNTKHTVLGHRSNGPTFHFLLLDLRFEIFSREPQSNCIENKNDRRKRTIEKNYAEGTESTRGTRVIKTKTTE